MPRPQRIRLPGIPLHLVHRGVDRRAVFVDDADRAAYLTALGESAQWYRLAVHAYCLMTNHVHLLVTPESADSVSSTMRRLGCVYVGRFNRRHARTGTLWEGRYRACLVDTDRYLLTCHRYIELNPVRAGLVHHPADYTWSSHVANVGGRPGGLLSPHPLYCALGTTSAARGEAYRSMFAEALSAQVLRQVRDALQHNHLLGNESFKSRIGLMLGRPLGTGRRGRPGNSCKARDGKATAVADRLKTPTGKDSDSR